MNEYEVACFAKARHIRRSHAKKHASRIRREGGPNLRPYQCRYCNQWHLGNAPGKATYLRPTINGPTHVQELT